MKNKKTVRGYSLEEDQREWLTKKALTATAKRNERVSDSEILREIIRKAMEKEKASK